MKHTIGVCVDHPYDVVIGRGLSARFVIEKLRENATKLLLVFAPPVTDYSLSLADQLRQEGYEVITDELPDGEEAKTLENLSRLWELAGNCHLGRADCVLAIGGGATTDVGGYLAASWLRGIDFIAVPTTLLGMVDASVGGKTGINTSSGKNLVGAFHSPRRVIVDLDRLETLSTEEYRAGLGEVIKCGFIADSKILELVESAGEAVYDPQGGLIAELIERSIAVKAEVVSHDLHESGPREFLNYGHTLAHAIEKQENYLVRHGEAVAIGCVFAAHMAHMRGILSDDELHRHVEVLSTVGLPTHYAGAPIDRLVEIMFSDKKVRGGLLRFVLLEGLTQPKTFVVSVEEVRECAKKMGMLQ